MYGVLYRYALLPLFDRVIKRRQTLGHWAAAERSQWWSRERHEAAQLNALQNLLCHAWETCPYFRGDWSARGLDPRRMHTFDDFTKWPLMERETIRNHREQMRTTRPLMLLSKSTGGSTGQPLHFELDAGSLDRRTALMYRGYGWAGGSPGTKQLYIWGGPSNHLSPFARLKQRVHARFERKRFVNCFAFTGERMREQVKTLNRYRPDVIVAYTNALYEFARFLSEQRLTPVSPRSLIVGAEKLHDFQRTLIESVFQAPVFETYGSREFMLIGGECERHEGLHLSMENLYVEILDDEGRPTPPGEEGNVVVTDLFNYGMPFIRYVNGDRAVAGWKSCSCGRGLPMITRVTGRRLDVLSTPDGRTIPGELFPHVLKDFPQIRRFQVVQRSPETITLKLVAPVLSGDDQRQLLDSLGTCLGDVVGVELEFVHDIPLTKVGKHKVVVREWNEESHAEVEYAGAR